MTRELPALCFGEEFMSVDRHSVVDLATGEELASLGLVPGTRIAVECRRKGKLSRALEILQGIQVRERIRMSVAAKDIFRNGTLDCGGVSQTGEEFVDLLSRSSGLPLPLACASVDRICEALENTEASIAGLTRGLPLDVFDNVIGEQGGAPVRFASADNGFGLLHAQ